MPFYGLVFGQRPTKAPKGPLTRSNFGQSQNNLAQRASQGVYKGTCSKTRPCKSVWQCLQGFKMPINLLDPLGGPLGQIVLALTKIGPCQWPLRGLGGHFDHILTLSVAPLGPGWASDQKLDHKKACKIYSELHFFIFLVQNFF